LTYMFPPLLRNQEGNVNQSFFQLITTHFREEPIFHASTTHFGPRQPTTALGNRRKSLILNVRTKSSQNLHNYFPEIRG
jgi:hypothetical protein